MTINAVNKMRTANGDKKCSNQNAETNIHVTFSYGGGCYLFIPLKHNASFQYKTRLVLLSVSFQ